MPIKALAFVVHALLLPSLAAGGFAKYGKASLASSAQQCIYCRTVGFPESFSGSGAVRVLASVSHGDKSSDVHDSAVVWTKQVTAQSFELCMMEFGEGMNGSAVVNWVAFQTTPSGILGGSASVGLFTSSTKCTRINFSQRFSEVPEVLATVRHGPSSRTRDALNLWVEDVHPNYFKVCLREVITFDGKHEDIQVDWLAFTSAPDEFTYSGDVRFGNTQAPAEEDGFAYCQVKNFTNEFFAAPVVILTANHEYDGKNSLSVKPENNIINAWAEEITIRDFRMCMRDKAGDSSQHDPVDVDYLVLGDLDPCINVTCSYLTVCKAFGPKDGRCVCEDKCPSYEEPVCATNGTTFGNECLFKKEMCHTNGNLSIYHPGSCTGFPSMKGRRQVRRSPSWAETFCELVPLSPYVFYPGRPIHVLATVNHLNDSDANFVHDAVVSWVENIDEMNFTVCVTEAGRNERRSGDFLTVDWLAFQGAPDGGVSGNVDMDTWWTGTSCESVNLPPSKFRSAPVVLLTAEHQQLGIKHDASSTWVEDVTSSSFKVCVRELQNFDGAHEKIHIDWVAFEELHRPLFREYGSTLFRNGYEPRKEFNYAFCKDVNFTRPYNETPNVLLTANHSTSGGNLQPEYNSISAWIEFITNIGFRACVKELHVKKHDPLSVSYTVMPDLCEPGWSFFNGSCFFTSDECQTWTNASTECETLGANLVTVRSQEENVFIQHRQNGAKSWIGLNDIAREGTFLWIDGLRNGFRFWADNQPNNMHRNQDCVHTLGISRDYKWNDVQCSECFTYTCEKEYDDCISNPCYNGGTCTDERNDFSCACPRYFHGKQCQYELRLRDSNVLNENTDYINTLAQYLSPVEVRGKTWVKCFTASESGYSASSFHSACDEKGPTVTLVKVFGKEHVFGGYTDQSWKRTTRRSGGRYSNTARSRSFLFSLKNDLNQQFKMQIYRYPQHAIHSHYSYGPIFGSGHDFLLYDNCNSNAYSSSNLGDTYREPTGFGYGSSQAQDLLAGSHNFKCAEYEVYYQP